MYNYFNDLVNRLTRVPVYYPDSTNKSADDLLDGVALIPLKDDCNNDLQSLLSGSYAYIITIIYATNISQATTSNRRLQIAISYNSIPAKMAIRIYGASGWTEWQRLASLSDLSSVTVSSCSSATYSSTANYAKNVPASLITNNAFPIPCSGLGNLPNTNLNSCRINIIIGITENDATNITNIPTVEFANKAGIFRSQLCGTYCLQEYYFFYNNNPVYFRCYSSTGWTEWKLIVN